MKFLRHFKRTRPLLLFLIALVLLLSAGAAMFVTRERMHLREQAGDQADRELHLLGAVVTQELIRRDYTAVREAIAAFGGQYEDIHLIKVTAPNGFVLAEHRGAGEARNTLARSYCVDLEPTSTKCVDIELVRNLDPIQRHLEKITRHAIIAAVLFAGFMGAILWNILRTTAFVPLERAVAVLHDIKGSLETNVAQRTADLMLANKELKEEISERQAAEKQLLIKDRAIASSVNGMALADFNGRLTYVNAAFLSMWGYRDQDQVLGGPAVDCWSSREDAQAVLSALKGKGRWIGELQAKRSDGSVFDVQLTAESVRDADGRPICLMASFTDISAKKHAERMLLQSESKFKSFAEQAIVGIYLIREGKIKYCNPRFAGIFGYDSPDALMDTDYQRLIHPHDVALVAERMEQRLRNEIPSSHYRFRGLRRTGEPIHLEVFGTTMDYEGKRSAIGTILDISESVLAEEALQASEAKHRLVLENISEIIYLVSLREGETVPGTVSFVSGQVAEIIGRRADEFLSDAALWLGLVHPADLPAVQEATEQLVRGGEPVTRLYRMMNGKRKDYVWIEDRIVPQTDEEGTVIGYFGAARDVTRSIHAEYALKEALARAQEEKNKSDAIVAAIGDGISIQDRDYTVLYQNETHKKLVGDHLGAHCYRAYEGKDSVCPGCPVALSFADGKVHTVERMGKRENRTLCVEITASPLRDAAGIIIAGIEVARNITDRKLMEDERERMISDLRRLVDTISTARREWQETFDSIRDMISIHDENNTIIRANRAFARHFGMEPRDVINKKCHQLFHKDGKPVWNCPHQRALERQEPATEEICDPATGRFLLLSTFPYASPDSGIRGSIHIARDITEIKEKEMQLIMSERLASLGQMASGIAHEINNPLAAIAGCVDGLSRRINRGEIDLDVFRKYLGIIKEEITRSKNITTSMLSVVRTSSYEKKQVDLVNTLEKALEIIGYQGRLKHVETRRRYPGQVPVVHGSEGELKQVFLIVLTNALDAMTDRGALTLELSTSGERLAIEITDTGPGIAPEMRQRVFDPFFTTKSERGGTGLGLTIARRIVTAHEGVIEILCGERQGTTVRIALPFSQSPTTSTQENADNPRK